MFKDSKVRIWVSAFFIVAYTSVVFLSGIAYAEVFRKILLYGYNSANQATPLLVGSDGTLQTA